MKKLLSIILIALLTLAGCGKKNIKESGKITIVATLFPQYDFSRVIGGDKVDVTLLLPAGSESHNYDPSPSDMALISKSDIFVYTGDEMEPWAGDIASAVGTSVKILNVSDNATLSSYEEHHENENSSHSHTLDPHIWLDFDNAKIMCENIYNALCSVSPENKDYFTENFESYIDKLTVLDKSYSDIVSNSEKTIVFGGKFALSYLVKRYNISYLSAYESCSANAEPSIADIAYLSDFVKTNNITVVYCEEYTEPKVALEIASGNNAEVLPIHSCHNLNRQDLEKGTT